MVVYKIMTEIKIIDTVVRKVIRMGNKNLGKI